MTDTSARVTRDASSPRGSAPHDPAPHDPAPHDPASHGAAPRALVPVLALCGIVVALMMTLIVPLIPHLPELLDTTPGSAAWAVTGTLLAAAVVTPISGRLGDMYGKRRILLASLAVVALGSAVCAVANDAPTMISGRTLQGMGMGTIPVGIAILRDVLPEREVPGAMAVISATMGVGGALGLPIAAAVAQFSDWHILFAGSCAVTLLVLLAAWRVVPGARSVPGGRFDVVGALGLSATLVLFLLPVTKGSVWGWTSPLTVGLLVAAPLVFLAWVALELRHDSPLVDLRVSSRRPVLLTNLASIAAGFAMYGQSLAFPQLLMSTDDHGFGLSILAAGLWMIPSGLVMMALSPVSARITIAYGPRTTLLTGLLALIAGYLVAYVLHTEPWHLAVASTMIGAGVGLSYAAMPALIMSSVPVSETAAANSLNSLMRSIGTSVSSAVVAAVLTTATTAHGTPSLLGFRITFAIAVVAGVVGVVLTLFIPRRLDAAPV